MRSQLYALLHAAERKNVTLQILLFTAGAHPAHDGAFTRLRLDSGGLEVVLVESLTAAQYVETEPELKRYRKVWSELSEKSLSEAASLAMIERLISET